MMKHRSETGFPQKSNRPAIQPGGCARLRPRFAGITVSTDIPSAPPPAAVPPSVPDGVRYARRAGLVLGLLLLGFAARELLRELGPTVQTRWINAAFITAFAFLQLVPWSRLRDERVWKRCYIAFCALTALFVFAMVIKVIFEYKDYYAVNRKMTIPGFQGLLIFLALMQPPAVLFERKPDLLD